MPILVDTNTLYALADVDDANHQPVLQYVYQVQSLLLVPTTILPELDYLLTTRLGVRIELAVLRSLAESRFGLQEFTAADLGRSIELVDQFSDSDIGLVDASIVAIAERLRITRILTLDHRHFRMFRPRHCETFELVP